MPRRLVTVVRFAMLRKLLPVPGTDDADGLARRLTRAARRARVGVQVRAVRPITGGISSESYRAVLDRGDDARDIVIKVAPAGLPPVGNRDVLRQAAVLTALRGSVPVPAVLFVDEGHPPDVPPLFGMELLGGNSFDPSWPRARTLSPAMTRTRVTTAVATLAAVHDVPVARCRPALGVVTLEDEIDRWARAFSTVDTPHASVIGTCVKQLEAHRPIALDPCLAHGDFQLGNLLFLGSKLTGVIDWELAGLADPRLDLEYLLMRYGSGKSSIFVGMAGVPSRDQLLMVYERARGSDGLESLSWFAALARFKVAAALTLLEKRNYKHGVALNFDPNVPSTLLQEAVEILSRLAQ